MSIAEPAAACGACSPSALSVAQARAVHQLLDEPLVLLDPLALAVLGEPIAQALREDPYVLNDPASRTMRAGIVARGRFAEDALARAVAQGARQYVVLGAGLDTFSLRNPYGAALRVFEVDQPATQSCKRGLLATLGKPVPASLSFVAMDLQHDAVLLHLAEAGLDLSRPAYVSALGVLPYLSTGAVRRVLSQLGALLLGSGIAFDYRVQPALLDPLERAMQAFSAQAFAAQGEPWLSDFVPSELQQALRDEGWCEVEDLGPQQLNQRYFHRRRDGLQTAGGGFRFTCAWR